MLVSLQIKTVHALPHLKDNPFIRETSPLNLEGFQGKMRCLYHIAQKKNPIFLACPMKWNIKTLKTQLQKYVLDIIST